MIEEQLQALNGFEKKLYDTIETYNCRLILRIEALIYYSYNCLINHSQER